MHYIVMDLEWNNTYAGKTKKFINEIIEIGAVMLDDELNQIDEFSCIVKAKIGKKLRGSVKRLTHITNDDIRTGVPFSQAIRDFINWIGHERNVILTWGDGDIRVLIENFRYLYSVSTIPFLSNYTDIQRYFQFKKNMPLSHQVGLSAAAEEVGMNLDDFSHHRALDDSLLTAECFRRVFDKNDFANYIIPCDDIFYKKLAFKPHAISNLYNPLVDRSLLNYTCEKCGAECKKVVDWKYTNQYFRAIYYCSECKRKVRVSVRFKQYFDHVETRKTVSEITEEKSPTANNEQNMGSHIS